MCKSLIFVSVFLFAQEIPKCEVRLKPEAGKPCVSRLTIDEWTTMTILDPTKSNPKATRTTKTRRLLVLRLEGVAPDKSGNHSIKVSLRRFLASGGSQSFDTEKPNEKTVSPIARFCHPLVGLSTTLKVEANGSISDIGSSNEWERKFLKRSSIPKDERLSFKEVIRLLLAQIPQVLSFSATMPVSIGESWSRSIPVPVTDNEFKAENKWTLKKTDNQRLVLDLASKLIPYTKVSEEETELAKDYVRYVAVLVGTQEGRLELDRKTGWPLKINLIQKLKGTATAEYRGRKSTLREDTVRLKVYCSITLEPDVDG